MVKPKTRGDAVSIPKRLNVGCLKNEMKKEELATAMEGTLCENTWDAFKSSVYETCEKMLGHCERKYQD